MIKLSSPGLCLCCLREERGYPENHTLLKLQKYLLTIVFKLFKNSSEIHPKHWHTFPGSLSQRVLWLILELKQPDKCETEGTSPSFWLLRNSKMAHLNYWKLKIPKEPTMKGQENCLSSDTVCLVLCYTILCKLEDLNLYLKADSQSI